MGEQVALKELKGVLERNIHATKGDAGRVLIIGNEETYVGALALAGLAALRGGADSVRIAAPEQTARLLNAYAPDLVTVKLPCASLGGKQLPLLKELAAEASVVLIGPGLGEGKEQEKTLAGVVGFGKPIVLDADATKQVEFAQLKGAIVLGNRREAERFASVEPDANIFVTKGTTDRIVSKGVDLEVAGGSVRATVAGTGDVLAGLAAAIFAQSKDALLSAKVACFLLKRVAEKLEDEQHLGWLASDMLRHIPIAAREARIYRITKHEPAEQKKASLLARWRGGNA